MGRGWILCPRIVSRSITCIICILMYALGKVGGGGVYPLSVAGGESGMQRNQEGPCCPKSHS